MLHQERLALRTAGHMIATNLHADTYEQARNQVCGDNRVPADAFGRMNLMCFLALDRRGWNVERRITAIWESDAQGDHRQVFGADASKPLGRATRLVSAGRLDAARKAIDTIMGSGVRTTRDVRAALAEDTTWTRSR